MRYFAACSCVFGFIIGVCINIAHDRPTEFRYIVAVVIVTLIWSWGIGVLLRAVGPKP